MGFWSKEIVILVVVAGLAALSAPAEGGLLGRFYGQTAPEAATGDKPEGNKPDGDKPDGDKSADSTPTKMSVGCTCDQLPAISCHCGVDINVNIFGNRIAFDPKLNVEFISNNASLLVSVTQNNYVLYEQELKGEDKIPPMCIPIPSYPLFGLCLKFHSFAYDPTTESVTLCTDIAVNTIPIGLPIYPRLPAGCFVANQKVGMKYNAPKISMPGKEQLQQLMTTIGKEQMEQYLKSIPGAQQLGQLMSMAGSVPGTQQLSQLMSLMGSVPGTPQLGQLMAALPNVPGKEQLEQYLNAIPGTPQLGQLMSLMGSVPGTPQLEQIMAAMPNVPGKEQLEQYLKAIPGTQQLGQLMGYMPNVPGMPTIPGTQQLLAYMPSIPGKGQLPSMPALPGASYLSSASNWFSKPAAANPETKAKTV